jgi:drug/metabolite transporter (DMT)-like permease
VRALTGLRLVYQRTLLRGLLGTLLVVKPPAVFGSAVGAEPLNPTGVIVTVFSALFCSIAMISIRNIGKRASPLVLAVWFNGSSTITGFLSCAVGWPDAPVWPSTTEWGLLLLISFTSFFGKAD